MATQGERSSTVLYLLYHVARVNAVPISSLRVFCIRHRYVLDDFLEARGELNGMTDDWDS